MYGETPYMGSRLVKGLKKAPDALCTEGFAMSNQNLKNIFFTFLLFYL